ncbi:hypothetical protein CPB84DRAFT_1773356 [Gymnopilus junonius]|uniref:DUF4203 domain-containing protein n=1 Tax=Gymnopilus junonius TaxID=109634 RepID=A0A9P5NT14_GYMJU|nr:hypothetical protein CPB84DRAFT_1773356 [Gymnopilus junonius]
MSTNSQLTPLLPTTPYLLAYTLPLLLLSLLLTFAGTFLTLDRSRSFPPTYGAAATGKGYATVPGGLSFEKTKKGKGLNWYLEGGFGGLAAGYIFGLHLSTALSLIIPATTPSAPLSSKSFLAVWILSCVLTTPLAGRYRYAALTFLGTSGGTLTALALCIITHPTLKSRIILVSIFLPLFTILVLLASTIPVARLTENFLHPLLRFCTASTGAFGVVMSIALLMNPKEEGWANAWERLWMSNGPPEGSPWGTGQEQGLSAAYAVFVAVGIAADWAFHRWIGECPDEKWDNYLAQYTANLPNQADRAGAFQPLTSFWDKIFPSTTPTAPFSKDILFPSQANMKTKSRSSGKLSKADKDKGAELTRVPTSVDLLKKKRYKAKQDGWKFAHLEGKDRKERKPIKFGEFSDDSDSDDDLDDMKASISPSLASASPLIERKEVKRPWGLSNAHHASSMSGQQKHFHTPKLDALDSLDYDQEIARLKEKRKGAGGDDRDDLDYSDYEEDIISPPKLGISTKMDEGQSNANAAWSPAFLKRHQSQQGEQGQSNLTMPMPVPVPVPATPSLIKAIDRLAVAQREAYGPPAASGALSTTQVPAANTTSARPPSPSNGHSKSKSPRGMHATLEDAEAGAVGMQLGMPALKKAERAPRWEEFWREVRVKARS